MMYDADDVISSNGNGSLSQNMQSGMKQSENYAGLLSKGFDTLHIIMSGHHGRQKSRSLKTNSQIYIKSKSL